MVPNFIDRSVWGAKDFGYISGAVPNITASTILGGTGSKPIYVGSCAGAFYSTNTGATMTRSENAGGRPYGLGFNASRSSSLYKSVNYVQPTSVAVRVKTRFV